MDLIVFFLCIRRKTVQHLCQCRTGTMLLLSGATIAIAMFPAISEMIRKQVVKRAAAVRPSGSAQHVAMMLESFFDFQCISGIIL